MTAYVAITDAIEVKVQSLREMPERGHQPHELYQVPNGLIFEIISNQYRIIYKIMAKRVIVIVIAIFDGRQDVKLHLSKRLTSLP